MIKTYQKLLMLVFIIAIALNTSCKKDSEQVIEIDLKVSSLPDTGEVDMDQYAVIGGQIAGTLLRDHTTDVHKGDIITWIGKSDSYNSMVHVKEIIYEDGVDVLESEMLKAGEGEVKRRVKSEGIKKDDIMKYSVMVHIIKDGQVVKEIKLDPKLRVL